jgi:hypothetical protein
MKQDKKETEIRELFQKLKREDEQHAPVFAKIFVAAQNRWEESRSAGRLRGNWPRWSLVAAASILVACGFIAYHKIHKDSGEGSITIKEIASKEITPAPRPSEKRESEAARSAVEPLARRNLRAPRLRRGNRPKLETASIRDRINAGAKENNEDTTDFYPLRYGDDNEPMESGDVIRVLMPRSALITLGLPVNVERADEPVIADLLVGEDGLARAIRFVR